MLRRAACIFVGWMLTIVGVILIVFGWLAHFQLWDAVGGWEANFVAESIVWPLLLTIVGIVGIALAVAAGRSGRPSRS